MLLQLNCKSESGSEAKEESKHQLCPQVPTVHQSLK